MQRIVYLNRVKTETGKIVRTEMNGERRAIETLAHYRNLNDPSPVYHWEAGTASKS